MRLTQKYMTVAFKNKKKQKKNMSLSKYLPEHLKVSQILQNLLQILQLTLAQTYPGAWGEHSEKYED